MVADTRLSTAFQGDMTVTGSSTLAVQKFLAQSLALTLQEPDDQRSIVVAPQRMPTAAQAQSMARALRGLDTERWTEPSDLITAAAATPDDDATTKVPASGRYPKKLRDQELPTQAFLDIQRTQSRPGQLQGHPELTGPGGRPLRQRDRPCGVDVVAW